MTNKIIYLEAQNGLVEVYQYWQDSKEPKVLPYRHSNEDPAWFDQPQCWFAPCLSDAVPNRICCANLLPILKMESIKNSNDNNRIISMMQTAVVWEKHFHKFFNKLNWFHLQ